VTEKDSLSGFGFSGESPVLLFDCLISGANVGAVSDGASGSLEVAGMS
jgi:hypothetical protein